VKIQVFTPTQKLKGITVNGNILKNGNQPPKKNKLHSKLIKIIFEYSPKKNNAKVIAEYSTL
jgi:hypothetical protein